MKEKNAPARASKQATSLPETPLTDLARTDKAKQNKQGIADMRQCKRAMYELMSLRCLLFQIAKKHGGKLMTDKQRSQLFWRNFPAKTDGAVVIIGSFFLSSHSFFPVVSRWLV